MIVTFDVVKTCSDHVVNAEAIQGQDFYSQGEVLLMEPGMAPSNSDTQCEVHLGLQSGLY